MKFAQKTLAVHDEDLKREPRDYMAIQAIWHVLYEHERPCREADALRKLNWNQRGWRNVIRGLVAEGRVVEVVGGYTLPEVTGPLLAWAEGRVAKFQQRLATNGLTPTERHRARSELERFQNLPMAFAHQADFGESFGKVSPNLRETFTKQSGMFDETGTEKPSKNNDPPTQACAQEKGEGEGEEERNTLAGAKKAGDEDPFAGPVRKRRTHQPPKDWSPPQLNGQCATITTGWDTDRWELELEAFAAHHLNRKEGIKDWNAAWRTWVLHSPKFERKTHERPDPIAAVARSLQRP